MLECYYTLFGFEFQLFIDNVSLIGLGWRKLANSGEDELTLPKGD